MKNLLFIFISLLSCVVVVEEREEKKTLEYKGREISPATKKIHLECPSGNIEVYGWNTDSIDLKYEILKGKGNVEVSKEGEETRIKVLKKKGGEFSIHMRLVIPFYSELKAEIGAGKISLENLDGDIDVEIGAGSIEVREVDGELKIEGGTGKVTALFEEKLPHGFDVDLGVGEVEIILNKDAEFDFSAECGIGKVETDFEFDEVQEDEFFIGGKFKGIKGTKEAKFDIEVGIGEVSLYKLE